MVPLSKRGPPLQGDRAWLPVAGIGDLNGVRVADRRPMTTSVEEADLPPSNNQSGACSRCTARGPIRVHFDRDCARARRPLPFVTARLGTSGSSNRAVHLVVDAAARILAHPRVFVGCPYTSPIRGHRVRQRPAGSPRFLTHAMGCDGVGNALNVNRTLEVGGSTPLGSTYDSAGLVLSQLSHARPKGLSLSVLSVFRWGVPRPMRTRRCRHRPSPPRHGGRPGR